MLVSQIATGSKVVLCVTTDTRVLRLETVITGTVSKEAKGIRCACIRPIYYKGKRLGLQSIATIKVEIIDARDNKLYIYDNAHIRLLVAKGQEVQCLFSNEDAQPVNRREAVRVPIHQPAAMRVNTSTSSVIAILEDISVVGLSLKLDMPYTCDIGDRLTVQFKSDELKCEYTVEAEVVRKLRDKSNEDVVTLGCVILEHPNSWNALIAHYLRKECRKKHTKQ